MVTAAPWAQHKWQATKQIPFFLPQSKLVYPLQIAQRIKGASLHHLSPLQNNMVKVLQLYRCISSLSIRPCLHLKQVTQHQSKLQEKKKTSLEALFGVPGWKEITKLSMAKTNHSCSFGKTSLTLLICGVPNPKLFVIILVPALLWIGRLSSNVTPPSWASI